MRKDRGIIIRIKKKKSTSRRRLGKGDAREKPEKPEERELEEKEEAPEITQEEKQDELEQPVEQSEIAEHEQIEDKIVLPGDLIGTSEEFVPKIGTFVDKGNIYASTTGLIKINNKERSISIAPVTNTPPNLKVGDIIVGQITDVKDSVALVEIAGIKGKGEREIVNAEQAAIHVSNVKDAYVKELYYEFAPFDIVKAKVIDLKSMRLTTVNKDLGVMKAFCDNCRTVLKIDNGKLKCPKCKRIETRKLSSDYGTGII